MNRRNLIMVVGATTLAFVFAGGGAVAATLVTSADIKDQTIRSVDIHANAVGKSEIRDNAVGMRELNRAVRDRMAMLASFGLSHLVTDGPYVTLTNTWVGDSGAALQTAIAKCDRGYYATGGGFSGNGGPLDTGTEADHALQITASYPYVDPPASINNGRGSIRANEWVVRGFNNGTSPLTVRPWVTCAPGSVG